MPEPADPTLRARLTEALRRTAFLCDDCCTEEDEAACDTAHPIQPTVLHFDQVADITGPVGAIASVALAVVQEELERRADEAQTLRIERTALRNELTYVENRESGNRRSRLEGARRQTTLIRRAEAERDRFRLAWKSARRRAAKASGTLDGVESNLAVAEAELAAAEETAAGQQQNALHWQERAVAAEARLTRLRAGAEAVLHSRDIASHGLARDFLLLLDEPVLVPVDDPAPQEP